MTNVRHIKAKARIKELERDNAMLHKKIAELEMGEQYYRPPVAISPNMRKLMEINDEHVRQRAAMLNHPAVFGNDKIYNEGGRTYVGSMISLCDCGDPQCTTII